MPPEEEGLCTTIDVITVASVVEDGGTETGAAEDGGVVGGSVEVGGGLLGVDGGGEDDGTTGLEESMDVGGTLTDTDEGVNGGATS